MPPIVPGSPTSIRNVGPVPAAVVQLAPEPCSGDTRPLIGMAESEGGSVVCVSQAQAAPALFGVAQTLAESTETGSTMLEFWISPGSTMMGAYQTPVHEYTGKPLSARD